MNGWQEMLVWLFGIAMAGLLISGAIVRSNKARMYELETEREAASGSTEG